MCNWCYNVHSNLSVTYDYFTHLSLLILTSHSTFSPSECDTFFEPDCAAQCESNCDAQCESNYDA